MHGSNIYIGECTKMLDSVSFQFECIARLILAAFCGAIIGLERKNRLKEAGTRTHLVVAFGSAMFMIVSKYGFFDFAQYLAQASNEFIKVDPSRVASSIVTGVGFLGAGTIFVRRQVINGLTTAAGLWATSAIGMAIGGGQYIVGLVGSLILVMLQWLLHSVSFFNKISPDIMVFRVSECEKPADVVTDVLTAHGISAKNMKIEKSSSGDMMLECLVKKPKALSNNDFINDVAANPYIKSIEF